MNALPFLSMTLLLDILISGHWCSEVWGVEANLCDWWMRRGGAQEELLYHAGGLTSEGDSHPYYGLRKVPFQPSRFRNSWHYR